MFSVFLSDAQELVQSYYYTDGYSIIPKMVLERENDNVIAYSITKNEEKKAGVLYINKDNTIKDAILFQGADSYVINEIIEADDGNLLISAEGYSPEGQESLYFIELEDNEIVNEFSDLLENSKRSDYEYRYPRDGEKSISYIRR